MPFADYFNHANEPGCKAYFDGNGYTFVTTRAHERGEEVLVSYGTHPNDFLWAEYGFFLDHNDSDVVYLDDIILSDLSPEEREELDGWQYLGNFQLFASEACYRTETAACLRYMPREDWRAFVLGQASRGHDDARTAQVVRGWIGRYLAECDRVLGELARRCSAAADESNGAGDLAGRSSRADYREQLCVKRWTQIRELCRSALRAYGG
ncbi:hypothetical protein KEM52_002475 [Ascosphaera acerosa]|nr:hypothetical protein KEM52_002475 [Ascosphaera acerosa]